MKVGIILVLYLILDQHFTFRYVAKSALVVSNMVLYGSYAAIILGNDSSWVPDTVIILVVPSRKKMHVLIASILSIVGLSNAYCVLIVVPALSFPNMPFNWGSYTPTWVEWSILSCVVSLGVNPLRGID